jgi:hypothetical protein
MPKHSLDFVLLYSLPFAVRIVYFFVFFLKKHKFLPILRNEIVLSPRISVLFAYGKGREIGTNAGKDPGGFTVTVHPKRRGRALRTEEYGPVYSRRNIKK